MFILNEDMNDIIKSIKSIENPSVFIDAVTETGYKKHEIKNNKGYLFDLY